MWKLLLFLVLFLFILNNVLSFENNADYDPYSKLDYIGNTLKTERWNSDYIDFESKDIIFWEDREQVLEINLLIKDYNWNIKNYNGIINIKPLKFWDNFIFWNIPNVINILNWKWNIKIPVSLSNNIDINKSWLWLILTSENKDLFWNVYTFAYWWNFININDYLSLLTIKNNNQEYQLIHHDEFKINSSTKNSFLLFATKIAWPRDININPFMVGFNILLALLYLILFYFTSQIFNSYFDKLILWKSINQKLNNIFTKTIRTPIKIFLLWFWIFFKKIKVKKWVNFISNTTSLFKKYEHKFYVILGLILLWIIWQITVDEFDILSLKWISTIFIMILILWLITFFKDFLLYFTYKKSERDNISVKNIPLWYVLAGFVASIWRLIWFEPNVLFGNVLRIESKNNPTEKKITSWSSLLKILSLTFIIWITFWFLTLFFDKWSFFYKFFMIWYFWIVNDVFFALLPFWLLWGTQIIKEKKIRKIWFIFTFIVLIFLIHTILNPEWDLEKIINFDWNILILVWFLLFWWIITFLIHMKIKNNSD